MDKIDQAIQQGKFKYITDEDLVNDLEAARHDIRLCNLAISGGKLYLHGKSLQDRIAENEEQIKIIKRIMEHRKENKNGSKNK